MTSALDAFITEARSVPIETVFARVGGDLKSMVKVSQELVGPCPVEGMGEDRFQLNISKGVFLCRGCGQGGDGIKLAALKLGTTTRGAGLILACEEILGRPAPDRVEETDEEKAAREKRIAERQKKAAEDKASRKQDADAYRERAVSQGRGHWLNAGYAGGSVVEAYLRLRTGAPELPAGLWETLRFAPAHSYYEGRDARGYEQSIYQGPAMIAPYVDLDSRVTASHQTWIMLEGGRKGRPELFTVTKLGREAGLSAYAGLRRPDWPTEAQLAAGYVKPLPPKKMRGSTQGMVIPIFGDVEACRWVAGEGIETVVGYASLDGFRADTFYFAAGSMGNLAGSADPDSAFTTEHVKAQDRNGVWRRARIEGPVPKPGSEDEVYRLPAHVTEHWLLGDGDSEPFRTAAAMERAEARHRRPGLDVGTLWPDAGKDWADMAVMAWSAGFMGNA